MRSLVRDLARRFLRFTERRLHPIRHRRAVRRLSAIGSPASVVVVCLGNICRSPYAERRLRSELRALGVDGAVTSAGFIRPGRPSPPAAVRAAADRGIDLAGHRSRLVTREELKERDVALVMSARQGRQLRAMADSSDVAVVVLGDLDPHPGERRVIVDPFDRTADVFESVYSRIDRCCDTVVRSLAGSCVE